MSTKLDDPRNSSLETPEILPYTWYRENAADAFNSIGMFLSGLIVVTRNRYMAWGSVVFAVSALINSHPIRAKEAGSQGWSTVLLCLSAMFASYFPLFVITNPVTTK